MKVNEFSYFLDESANRIYAEKLSAFTDQMEILGFGQVSRDTAVKVMGESALARLEKVTKRIDRSLIKALKAMNKADGETAQTPSAPSQALGGDNA